MLARSSDPRFMHLLVLAGDGIGPEITAATLSVLRAASERFGLGLADRRGARSGTPACARMAARFTPTSSKRRAGRRRRARPDIDFRIQGSGAGRDQSVDDAAQESRSVRQYPAGADLSGIPVALRRVRSRRRAREHRRLLCRPQYGGGERRGAGDEGRRHFIATDHARLQRAHCARGVRAGDDHAVGASRSCTRPMC